MPVAVADNLPCVLRAAKHLYARVLPHPLEIDDIGTKIRVPLILPVHTALGRQFAFGPLRATLQLRQCTDLFQQLRV